MNVNFALDPREVFAGKEKALKKYYFDFAEADAKKSKDPAKIRYVSLLHDWVLGKLVDTSEIREVMARIEASEKNNETLTDETSGYTTDQNLKFAKAVNIASLLQADVKKVEWLTAGDQRVRESHKRLNNKIFNINKLPREFYDFKCRCTVIAVFE